jgi:hypothetical protein
VTRASNHLRALGLDESRQRSHIIPGPYFGYWNSSMRLVTCLELVRDAPAKRARIGSHTALHSDMPLMRCAPQSAEISDGRDAPHLLVVGLEEVLVEPPAVVGAM